MNLGINFMSSGQDPTGEEKETPCFKTDNYAERSRIMKERLTNEEWQSLNATGRSLAQKMQESSMEFSLEKKQGWSPASTSMTSSNRPQMKESSEVTCSPDVVGEV